jgi:hypothetical protein
MAMDPLSLFRNKVNNLDFLSQFQRKKNNIPTQVAMGVGALLGAASQEDNSNAVFTMPIATVIGAITGLSLDFHSPIVHKTSKPDEVRLKYDYESLKKAEINKHTKVDNFVNRMVTDENRYSILVNGLKRREEELAEILFARDLAEASGLDSTEDLNHRAQKLQKYVDRTRDKIEKLEPIKDARLRAFAGFIDDVKNSGDSRIEEEMRRVLAEAKEIDPSDPQKRPSPAMLAKRIVENIGSNQDERIADKIMSSLGMKIHKLQTIGKGMPYGLDGEHYHQNFFEPIKAGDINKAPDINKAVKITNLTEKGDIDNIVNRLLDHNKTPLERRPGIELAIGKIIDEAKKVGGHVEIDKDSVAIKKGSANHLNYKMVKYGDAGERFTRSSTGTIFPTSSFNPLGSLMAKNTEFDFSQVGEVSGPSSKRIPGTADLVMGYDPIESVNFFGVNKDSERIAGSLGEFISGENALAVGDDRTYKTGLGRTVGRQIELKHTLPVSGVDSSTGAIIQGENRVSKIVETPRGGVTAEMTSVINSLTRDFPETQLYGQTHTSRKTSIVNPKAAQDQLISPVPNAARAGQGTLNRGHIGQNPNASPSVSSATRVSKKVLVGTAVAEIAPHLLGPNISFADGFALYNRAAENLKMREHTSFTVAPIGNQFDLNIDRIDEFNKIARIEDAELRRKEFAEAKLTMSKKKEIESFFDNTAYNRDTPMGETASRMMRTVNEKGIRIHPNDVVGYSPDGIPQRLPGYFSYGHVADAQLLPDGNLKINVLATYDPGEKGEVLKMFSQPSKTAAGAISEEATGILVSLDELEGASKTTDVKFNSSTGEFEHVQFNFDKDTERGPFLKLLQRFNGNDLSGVRLINSDESTLAWKGGNAIDSDGILHMTRTDLTSEVNIGRSVGALPDLPDVIFSANDSGFDKILSVRAMNTKPDIYAGVGKEMKNFGIEDFKNYKHEFEDISVQGRVAAYEADYTVAENKQILEDREYERKLKALPPQSAGAGKSGKKKSSSRKAQNKGRSTPPVIPPPVNHMASFTHTPLEFAKKEALTELLYHTYTSENKIAADIHSKLIKMEEDGVLPKITINGKTTGIQEIVDQKMMLSSDKDIREQATRGIRETIREVATSRDILSSTGSISNMISDVALEQGLEIHGAGNTSRLSWIAADQLRANQMDTDMLLSITKNDAAAAHELEMFRLNSTIVEGGIDTSKLGKKDVEGIIRAVKAETEELRLEGFNKLFPLNPLEDKNGMVTFNLPGEKTGSLRSVSFSTVKTGRSGVFDLEEKQLLAKLDKAKMGIVTSYIGLQGEKEGTTAYNAAKSILDAEVNKYGELHNQALTVDSQSNIGKRANSLIGKSSEIRVVTPIGGIVANQVIPKLREAEGAIGGYNIYFKDQVDEMFDKYGLSWDDHDLVKLTDDTVKDGENVFKLVRKYDNDKVLPFLEMSTREPAQGPYSSMVKEVLLVEGDSGLPEGKRTHTVGIAVDKEGKYIESTLQKMDFDIDTTGNIAISLEDEAMQSRFLDYKRGMDTYLKDNYDWMSKTGVKGKSKKMISVDQMNQASKVRGTTGTEEWVMAETNLARKGVLRKTMTPQVTSFALSLNESIDFAEISGRMTSDQAIGSRFMVYSMVENILKTQHEATEKAVVNNPKIARAMDLRSDFLHNKVSNRNYMDAMKTLMSDYTQPTDATIEGEARYAATLESLVEADSTFATQARSQTKNVLSLTSNKEGKILDPNYYDTVAQNITDVTINRPGKDPIFNIETPSQTSSNVGGQGVAGSIIDSGIDAPIETKAPRKIDGIMGALGSLTERKNVNRMMLGAGALIGTTIVLGRDPSMPSNQDLGQSASKTITPEVPVANSNAYLHNEKTTSQKSVRVSGIDDKIPTPKMEKIIYGDNMVSHRVRDERG